MHFNTRKLSRTTNHTVSNLNIAKIRLETPEVSGNCLYGEFGTQRIDLFQFKAVFYVSFSLIGA